MTIRDMLVTIEDTKSTPSRVELAVWLAGILDAHLIGLHAAPFLPDAPGAVGYYDAGLGAVNFDWEQYAAGLQAVAVERAAAVEAARGDFEQVISRTGRTGEWRLAEDWRGAEIALHARYVDLAVIGQTEPGDDRLMIPDPGEIALGSGCPALIVPYAGRHETIERNALIAWNGSREARRAVQDALPLLTLVSEVTVLSIAPHRGIAGRDAGADIALHLARHGLKVTVEQTVADGLEPADLLLSRAADLGSDLIVMGAYGHSRMREMTLGGTTRSMLRQMTVPVLMSH